MKVQIRQSSDVLNGLTLAEMLEPFKLAYTIEDAVSYLKEHTGTAALLSLYRHYFPTEFKKSTANRRIIKGQAFSDMEVEFFRSVNKYLFPLKEYLLDYMVEEWASEWQGEFERPHPSDMEIPVEPAGLGEWEEANRGCFRPAWQLLMEAAYKGEYGHGGPSCALPDNLLDCAGGIAMWDVSPGGQLRFDEAKLSRLIAKQPKKYAVLHSLPGALRVLARETSYTFLDAYEDPSVGPTIQANWTREEMDWLIEEYRQCSGYMSEVNKLLDWMEKDTSHMWRVVSLLSQCVEGEKPGRGRTRVRAR